MVLCILRTARTAVIAAMIGCSLVPAAFAAADQTAALLVQGEALLQEGRVVEAQDVLMRVRASATGAERDRAVELLAAADRRMRNMGEAESSLQKAELALMQGDLRKADMHANTVRRSAKATTEERVRASAILDKAASEREVLAPLVPGVLEQAVRDFDADRFAEAKAGLVAVSRSGVRLNKEQSTTLRRYQERILDVERETGEPIEAAEVALGDLGDGAAVGAVSSTVVVVAMQDDPASEPGNPAYIDEPENDGWADQAQPAATNTPSAPQSGDDLFVDAERVDSQRVLAEADAAYEKGMFAEANQKYLLASTTYARWLSSEELAHAQSRLEDTRGRLGAATGALLDLELTQRRIMREQVLAEVENLESQAKAALDAGDFDAALGLVAQAQLRWSSANAQGLLAETEFADTTKRLSGLEDGIRGAERAAAEAEVLRAGRAVEAEQRSLAAQQQKDRSQRINESLARLRALQREQKYEEALQVVEEVLFLDPTNPAAQLMKDILSDIVLYRDFTEIGRRRGESYAREMNEIQRGMIVPHDIIDYPSDWPELSMRRGTEVAFAESPADRLVLANLSSKRIPASFQDNALENVLQFIATVTNLNFDVDWASLSEVGIEKDTQVSLELREVSAQVVLDRVLQKVSLDDFNRASWAVQDGIVVVASDDDLRRNTFIVIYDVRDLLFDVNNYTQVPELDLDAAVQQSQGGGGGGGGQSIFEDDEEEEEQRSPEEQLRDLLEIIQTNVDIDGWSDNGGDTGIVQTLNQNLIITNTARNHREIQALLDKLREVRSVQISVETRILQVSTDFFEKIGFDIDLYLNGNDQRDAAISQVQGSSGLGTFFGEGTNVLFSDLVGGGGTGNASGYGTDGTIDATTGLPTIVFFGDATNGPVPYTVNQPTNGFGTVPIQQGSDALTDNLISGLSQFASGILSQNPALGIAGTFLDDIQVDFLIEATQADQRTVTLTAPRLTFMNGKAANLAVSTQQAYVSALNPVVGTSAAGFDPTISTLNTGFSLLLQGVVSADRRYVTLNAEVTTAEDLGFTAQEVSIAVGGAGGSIGGGVVTDTFQVPRVLTTRIRTGLTIPDQGTALLGGQRVASEIDVETGVPVLSKVPLINRFFTNTATVRQESTLLILLKPKILIQAEQEEDLFPGLQDRLDNSFGF
jgi:type II secretory pathway component GspD/PulD (secretin)/tetratricopeptide (TPR) repeat protein